MVQMKPIVMDTLGSRHQIQMEPSGSLFVSEPIVTQQPSVFCEFMCIL